MAGSGTAVLFPLPIIAASGYADGSPLQRVPAQIVEVTWVLRVNEEVFKNDVIRQ